jgi:hypothetical protein
VTYLSPGIPQAFFEAVIEHVRRALGRRASLSVETRVSGPMRGTVDPFSKGEVDIGFVCAPSFFWLREMETRRWSCFRRRRCLVMAGRRDGPSTSPRSSCAARARPGPFSTSGAARGPTTTRAL